MQYLYPYKDKNGNEWVRRDLVAQQYNDILNRRVCNELKRNDAQQLQFLMEVLKVSKSQYLRDLKDMYLGHLEGMKRYGKSNRVLSSKSEVAYGPLSPHVELR